MAQLVGKGRIALANDAITAGLVSTTTTETRAAVNAAVAPAVSTALADPSVSGIVSSAATTAVNAKVAGLDLALRGDFASTDLGATFTFPKNSVQVPNGTYTKTDVIDATVLPAATNLNGTNTTGAHAVASTSTGSPAFTTDATQTSFKIVSGTGAASFSSTTNLIAFKIVSLPTFGSGLTRGLVCLLYTSPSPRD